MSHKIIEIGIILLLVFTPLAFGGVTPGALALLKLLSAGLLLLWLIQQIVTPKANQPSIEVNSGYGAFLPHPFVNTVFIGASFLFLGVIYVQTLALPVSFTKILSPASYVLYSEAARNTNTSLPPRMPLSVFAYTTESELAKLMAYAIIFFLIVQTLRSRKQITRLLHVIFIVGSLEGVYGFLQFFSATPLLDIYPARANWVGGTFVNKNHFAGYLEMVIPLCFALLLTQFRQRSSTRTRLSPDHFRETYPKIFLLFLALFFMIASLLLSGSRGGVVSFGCGTIMFILLARQRRLLRRKVVFVLMFAALSIVLTIFLNPEILTKRIYTFNRLESDSSFLVRRELWKSALHIFQDYPIVGSGLGSFTQLNPRYRTFRAHLRHYEYAENDYVQLLAETGIVGVAFVLVIGASLGVQLFILWRQRHSRWKIALVAGGLSGMFSLLIHSGTDFNFRIPSNALLFVTIAALCVSIARLPGVPRNGLETSSPQFGQLQASGLRRTGSPFFRTVVLLVLLLLITFFLFHTAKHYLAERHYQFADSQHVSEESVSSSPQESPMQMSRDSFERVFRAIPNNAEYARGLGKLLFDMTNSKTSSSIDATSLLHESEAWMKQAILLNPSNPWVYYELGRMNHERDVQASAVYFRAALKNAPKEMFLRKAVGQWFLFYDKTEGQALLRKLASGDKPTLAEEAKISEDFARLLYDFHLDDDVEQERSRRKLAEGQTLPARCRPKLLAQEGDSAALEFGDDAGSAEWKARLTNETERVHKAICLPEELADYQYSALKIYMNNGGQKNFTASLSINGQPIKRFERTIPHLARWYEIPFEKKLLEGRSTIDVYIRVEHASEDGNFLQIWGESQSSNKHSTWNFDNTEDLSPEKGSQQGEYLIRLVLKK